MRTHDPISGTWGPGDGNFIRLRWDGATSLAGIITVGAPNNLATVKRGSFDAATRAFSVEGDGVNPRTGETVAFAISGTIDGDRMQVRYRMGENVGDGVLRRITLWSLVTGFVASILRPMERRAEGLPPYVRGPLNREQLAALRHTKAQNEMAMRERGETIASLKFREPTEADIPALSRLHVYTWAATYPDVYSPPTYAIRSWQWRDAFRKPDPDKWFVIVIENVKGELVGFLRGIRGDGEHKTNGDVNKIYLLDDYQRMGLGSRMLGRACRRFMQMGCATMTVHAEADNPSCAFYEATGGVVIVNDKGTPEPGNYVWRDLPALSMRCPD